MAKDPVARSEARIVTVPNVITLVRLACVPVFVWLLADDELLAAAGLLAVLGATDWVDGWVARRFDQGSDLGKVFDPVADRILLLVAGVALVVQGSVPLVVGILVLARELVVSVAVLALAAAGARRLARARTFQLFGRLVALPRYLARTGWTTVMWDVEPDSHADVAATPEGIVAHVLARVRPGSIILLHPWYPSRATSRAAIPTLVDSLHARGYRVATVGELLGAR